MTMSMKESQEGLLKMILSKAPNKNAELAVVILYVTIRKSWDTEDQILQALASVLYDGLTYGNWPWPKE